jgi:hypothetical protein
MKTPLGVELRFTHLFYSLYIFIETPVFELQNRLFIVMPDQVRHDG